MAWHDRAITESHHGCSSGAITPVLFSYARRERGGAAWEKHSGGERIKGEREREKEALLERETG